MGGAQHVNYESEMYCPLSSTLSVEVVFSKQRVSVGQK